MLVSAASSSAPRAASLLSAPDAFVSAAAVTSPVSGSTTTWALKPSCFLSRPDRSAGAARPYTGAAGRIENSQVGTFFMHSAARGGTFLDRELDLPKM